MEKALSRGAGLSAYSLGKRDAFQSELVEEMTKFLQEIGSQLKTLQDGNGKRNTNFVSNQPNNSRFINNQWENL